MDKKKAIFFCTFPDKNRGFTGANIGNKVTYELLKDQFDITLIDLGTSDFKPESFNLAHVKYNFKIFFHYFKKINQLKALLKADKYEYLYFLPGSVAKGHLRDILLVKTARKHVTRIIGHNRNGNFKDIYSRKWHRILTEYFINAVDKFIFLSDNLKASTNHFIDDSKSIVAFNPIDSEVICTAEDVDEKIKLHSDRQGLNVLYLSNMIPSKGYKDLAQAVIILKNKGFTKFIVHFVGRWNTAADEEEMKFFVTKNNIAPYVVFHGKETDRNIIKNYLLDADLFVLPTYYPIEAQPRSIIEAINAGTPIIATRHASIPEMITDGKEGILVDKQSPQQLADAILSFSDYNTWRVFAQNARKTFEARFSYNAVKKQLIAAFND